MVSKLIYPLMIVLSVASAYVLTKVFAEKYYMSIPALIAGFVIVATVALEIMYVYSAEWRNNRRHLPIDLVHSFLFFPVITQLAALSAKFLCTQIFVFDLEFLPQLFQFLVVLLAGEFLFYWFHRLSHHYDFLWYFHRTHHTVKKVYWANAAYFHGVDLFFNFFLHGLPLFLFKIDAKVSVFFITLNVVTGLWEHANVNYHAGKLNFIFNTAEMHRWHHSKNLYESNKNFGKILCVWDIVFHTWYLPLDRHVGELGIHVDAVKELKSQPLEVNI